jgi:hypothetical protein
MLPDAVRSAIARATSVRRGGPRGGTVEEPVVLVSFSRASRGAEPDKVMAAVFGKLSTIVGNDLQQSRNGKVERVY